ncbi:2-polyprenylphenol 6-hydroxylase [Nitzschia inconspicua]|uniref:2-polyprenylphenol 6-hydroxylase n=1 Tax=Nitzschia inconspicua TaxID=303405 RepID=A0A9K3LQ78_9STRA|nr:2-polyprenylphenol 6-hydroxylase [Nitzschia inconspicua]
METHKTIFERLLEWLRLCWRRIGRVWLVTARSTEVVLRLSPLIILSPFALVSSHIFQSTLGSDLAWNYTIKAIQSMGPVAIKFCQWAATRRDIFPPFLCDRLSVLHDRGYPHSDDWTDQVLTEAFGDYRSKGLILDDVIGCGSAAQVYRGKLTTKPIKKGSPHKNDSCQGNLYREVAVKVLHPRFQSSVDRDLFFIEIMADFLDSLPIERIKMLNLPRVVEEFSVVLRDQADLTIEAKNLRRFRFNFYQDSEKREIESSIVFPQPVEGWTSSQVMVEDYVNDAVPIASFLKDSSPEGMEIRKELAGPLLRAFLKMVFTDNYIHCDLHPGNVLVKTALVSKSPSLWNSLFRGDDSNELEDEQIKRSIVFLDAGISTSLSPNDQKNLVDLFRAVIFNDGNRAGRLMIERAKHERCSEMEGCVDAFADGIQDIVSEFHDRRKEGLTLGAVRIGVLLSRVLDLCRVYGVEIDPAMANVVISTLVLEGLGRSLSPDLDLLTFAKPFVLGRGKV